MKGERGSRSQVSLDQEQEIWEHPLCVNISLTNRTLHLLLGVSGALLSFDQVLFNISLSSSHEQVA